MPSVRAHAKLNLALAVAPPEPADADRPGWHRIASWFHAVELHDTIKLDPGEDGFAAAWADGSPVEWPTDRDLAHRAKTALETALGRTTDARVAITKSIPTGAGLGGGSSDASATLAALNALSPEPLAPAALAQLAAPIGSDLAFFLDPDEGRASAPPRPALVHGFGDAITRLDPIDRGVVLIIPPFGCSTPEVYRAYDADPRARSSFDVATARIRTMAEAGVTDGLFNDLERAACDVEPRLIPLLDTLRGKLGRPVHMTGSGSALFTLCDRSASAGLAEAARDAIGHDARVIETFLI